MGDHFKTDIGQLQQFLTNLEKCVDELNEARSALDHVRADQIGTPRLDEACDKFQDEWKYGSEKTKELIDDINRGREGQQEGLRRGRGSPGEGPQADCGQDHFGWRRGR